MLWIFSDKTLNIQSTITTEAESTGKVVSESSSVTSTDIIPALSPLARDFFHLSTSCLYDILKETPTGIFSLEHLCKKFCITECSQSKKNAKYSPMDVSTW